MKLPLALLASPLRYALIGMAAALALSVGGNLYQSQARKAAAAECERARIQVVADYAAGTAAAVKAHADQIAAIALQSSTDETARIKALDEATRRIASAASRYASAKAQPLPEGCTASGDRVDAVNAARGHE